MQSSLSCVSVYQVTLMLMDQGPLKKHLGDAFKPDPNSSSFRRPVVEMNIASGCPLFVSQSVLETGSYIKDDTIFIKVSFPAAEASLTLSLICASPACMCLQVTVDTSDLPEP